MAIIDQNCIYKTVTMVAGETFVLPPGAEVISVSDLTRVSSSCGELSAAETLCWQIHWVLNEDPDGTKHFIDPFVGPGQVTLQETNNAWEDTDSGSSPIYIGKMGGLGTVIDNGTSVSVSDLAALENAIANSAVSGALTERKYKFGTAYSDLINTSSDNVDSGYHSYDFYFRATAEIAALFYLQVTGDGGNIIHVARMFGFEMDCEDFDAITSDVTMC